MRDYTFRVGESEGPALHFELMAEGDEEAVEKAKRLIVEQSDGDCLDVELTYGLTGGRIWLNPACITAQSIVRSRELSVDTEPF